MSADPVRAGRVMVVHYETPGHLPTQRVECDRCGMISSHSPSITDLRNMRDAHDAECQA